MASSHHRLTLKLLLALVTLATVDLRPCLAQSSVMPSQPVAAASSDVSIMDPSSMLIPETTPQATTVPVMASETPSASPAPSPTPAPTPTPAPSPAPSSSAPAPAPSSSEAVEASSSMLAAPPSSSPPELSSSAAMTTSETSSAQPSETPTESPTGTTETTGTTESTSSPEALPMAAIIGIAAGGGLLLAVVVCGLLICLCCCLRKSSRSATYDATRGRPVYVVRRWDERTEHVPNRGGSFRGSKGSIARSSIRSSISSIASMLRLSGRRSRNNSLSRSGMGEMHTNPTIMKVTPI